MDSVDKINVLMRRRGMTAAELCQLIGISGSSYTLWKQKKTKPTIKNLKKIAEVFGVDIEILFEDRVDAPPQDPNKDNEDLLETFAMIRTNPAMQYLFQKVKNLTPNQLFALAQMVEAFKE